MTTKTRKKQQPAPETALVAPPMSGKTPLIFAAFDSALGMLREGIVEADWTKVREAFSHLTGQELPPSTATDYRAVLDNIAGQLSTVFGGFSQAVRGPAPVESPKKPLVQNQTQAEEDTDSDSPLDAEEREMSRRESVRAAGRERQTRTPFRYLQITCSKCNKEREVHPVDAPKRLDKEDVPSAFVCEFCLAGAAQ